MVNTLIIPAAGAGTRLRPITYATSKEMIRLVDKPIVYYILLEAKLAGITNIVFIIHTDNKATKEFFESERAKPLLVEFSNMCISFIETDERRGDGQALLLAKNLIQDGESFAVSMGDLITMPGTSLLKELIEQFNTIGPVISVMDVPRARTAHYGVIEPKESNGRLHLVNSFVEKPKPEDAPSTLASCGKYILTPEIFKYLKVEMQQNTDGEIKLAHALASFAKKSPLYAYHSETMCYDTGLKTELLKTEIAFSLEHPELKSTAREILKDFKSTL